MQPQPWFDNNQILSFNLSIIHNKQVQQSNDLNCKQKVISNEYIKQNSIKGQSQKHKDCQPQLLKEIFFKNTLVSQKNSHVASNRNKRNYENILDLKADIKSYQKTYNNLVSQNVLVTNNKFTTYNSLRANNNINAQDKLTTHDSKNSQIKIGQLQNVKCTNQHFQNSKQSISYFPSKQSEKSYQNQNMETYKKNNVTQNKNYLNQYIIKNQKKDQQQKYYQQQYQHKNIWDKNQAQNKWNINQTKNKWNTNQTQNKIYLKGHFTNHSSLGSRQNNKQNLKNQKCRKISYLKGKCIFTTSNNIGCNQFEDNLTANKEFLSNLNKKTSTISNLSNKSPIKQKILQQFINKFKKNDLPKINKQSSKINKQSNKLNNLSNKTNQQQNKINKQSSKINKQSNKKHLSFYENICQNNKKSQLIQKDRVSAEQTKNQFGLNVQVQYLLDNNRISIINLSQKTCQIICHKPSTLQMYSDQYLNKYYNNLITNQQAQPMNKKHSQKLGFQKEKSLKALTHHVSQITKNKQSFQTKFEQKIQNNTYFKNKKSLNKKIFTNNHEKQYDFQGNKTLKKINSQNILSTKYKETKSAIKFTGSNPNQNIVIKQELQKQDKQIFSKQKKLQIVKKQQRIIDKKQKRISCQIPVTLFRKTQHSQHTKKSILSSQNISVNEKRTNQYESYRKSIKRNYCYYYCTTVNDTSTLKAINTNSYSSMFQYLVQ